MSLTCSHFVADYYTQCAETISDDARAMGWSSGFNQRLRFEIINYLVDLDAKDVLDVGCGDGGLFHFCLDRNISINYKGIDLSKGMVQRAQNRYPGISVRECDFFDYQSHHDVVVASGALSICQNTDPMVFLDLALDKLLNIANEHVLINLLSDQTVIKDDLFNYYSPGDVFNLCLKKTAYITLHHSYLPNDFTLHLVKI
ncbi:MAG: class I SAM-dependent methyltransferase [Candidatus Margulisiibacteriota bacterium]